jgi:hypothetical protein
LVAVVTVLPALAAEEEKMERVTPTRSFERFELDSETVEGFWAEAGAQFGRDSDENVDDPTAFGRLAYGRDNKWEASLLLPYGWIDGPNEAGFDDENGLGDLQLSGKYIPLRGEIIDLGAGALVSFPTGKDEEGLGESEFGGGPFITGSINLDMARFYAHIGGEFFTGSGDGLQAENRILYGFALLLPVGPQFVLRNEFAGINFYNVYDNPKDVSYFPGVDVRVPIGNLDLLLRPTGLVGISSHAPDWGFGGSLTITSPTTRAAKEAPGEIFIEE